MTNDFELRFNNWLSKALKRKVPASVRGFCFNLYEPANVKGAHFAVELIGSSQYDATDPDWPCYECWQARPRGINIPITYSGKNWEKCLEVMKALTLQTLSSDNPISNSLEERSGVGIGFVDGVVETLWEKPLI